MLRAYHAQRCSCGATATAARRLMWCCQGAQASTEHRLLMLLGGCTQHASCKHCRHLDVLLVVRGRHVTAEASVAARCVVRLLVRLCVLLRVLAHRHRLQMW